VAGFGGGIAAARSSHPSTHNTSSSASTQAVQATQSASLGFGSGSYVAPATSAPVIQSSGS
jgi:hypothetical protein